VLGVVGKGVSVSSGRVAQTLDRLAEDTEEVVHLQGGVADFALGFQLACQ
jgi:hypothetical protein